MSIATEITRLQSAKANIKTSIEGKGVVVSSSDKLDDYSSLIDSINISTQEKVVNSQNYTREITPDVGYRGLSKVVLEGVLVDTHDSYTSTTDDDVAYEKIVPSGALKYATLDKLGGMSYKYNQLVQNGNFSDSTGWSALNGTLSVSNNVLTNTSSGGTLATYTSISKPISHKVLVVFNAYASESVSNLDVYCGEALKRNISISTTNTQYSFIATVGTGSNSNLNFSISNTSSGFTLSLSNVMCIDLTQIFGVGNEPSDVATATTELLKRGIDITTYNDYNLGTIRNSAITSVVSKDSNNITLDTFTIPSEVQALSGYGWGVNDTCYNYIDYESKKFIQKVGRVDLGSIDYTYNSTRACFLATLVCKGAGGYVNANALSSLYEIVGANNIYANAPSYDMHIGLSSVNQLFISNQNYTDETTFKTAMSGVYLYYELATPIETDISQYLDNNTIEVEENGTLVSNNTYEQKVPSEITYLVEV